MRCSYCNSRAVFFAQHFGKGFCKKHLEIYLLKKLRRNLRGLALREVSFSGDDSPAGWAARDLFKKASPARITEGGTKIDTSTLECETGRIIEALAAGKIPERDEALKPFRDSGTKELFTLGWLRGREKEELKKSPTGSLGAAAKLNLLRTWERILEVSGHRLKNANKEAGRKR